MGRAPKSVYSRPTPPGHRHEVRRPKNPPPDFRCPVCCKRFTGDGAVYDPRRSVRCRTLVCESCAVWFAGMRHADERYPETPLYSQPELEPTKPHKVSRRNKATGEAKENN